VLSRILGTIQGIYPQGVELSAQSFTFYIETPKPHYFHIGQQIEMHTHLSIRDDGSHLYGFSQRSEKDLFLLLLKVHSIGPKLALQILQSDVKKFILACRTQDKTILCSIPGIGAKTAARILAELDLEQLPVIEEKDRFYTQAKQLLITLGFTELMIDDVLPNCAHESLDELVKEALKKLGEKRGKSTIFS
jgi:holliday junction DNA helicase RuvA